MVSTKLSPGAPERVYRPHCSMCPLGNTIELFVVNPPVMPLMPPSAA